VALTDADGATVNTYQYDVFGAVRSSTGSQANAFNFTGEEVDASTGLEYLRARYFDPQTSRFTGANPRSGSVSFPVSLNRYTCVLNNPAKRYRSIRLVSKGSCGDAAGKAAQAGLYSAKGVANNVANALKNATTDAVNFIQYLGHLARR
jgi:RHS repeat-associated protein